ncbi:MAG: hypothetical protein JRD69_09820 [Deltaproteobacteria bacterium]|nr:hypothetical protein [Deltaproteobacteria bacterium]
MFYTFEAFNTEGKVEIVTAVLARIIGTILQGKAGNEYRIEIIGKAGQKSYNVAKSVFDGFISESNKQ